MSLDFKYNKMTTLYYDDVDSFHIFCWIIGIIFTVCGVSSGLIFQKYPKINGFLISLSLGIITGFVLSNELFRYFKYILLFILHSNTVAKMLVIFFYRIYEQISKKTIDPAADWFTKLMICCIISIAF